MPLPIKLDLEIIQGDSFSLTFSRLSEDYLNYKGEWSSLLDYEVDDVVTYKNTIKKCILNTTANQLPSNATYFGAVDPYDYSACTFYAKIRTEFNEEASVADFNVAYLTDGTDGKFQITLTAVQTAALDFDTAVYDIEVTEAGEVRKEARGKVNLKNEATY